MESTVVTSTRVTSAGIEQTSVSRVRMAPALFASAPVGPIALSDVRSVVEVREAERTELQELNQRFATCIEKVRYLEEENARIVEEMAEMRHSSAESTEQVRESFDEQLAGLRRELEESEIAKGEVDVRLTIFNNKISSIQGLWAWERKLKKRNNRFIYCKLLQAQYRNVVKKEIGGICFVS